MRSGPIGCCGLSGIPPADRQPVLLWSLRLNLLSIGKGLVAAGRDGDRRGAGPNSPPGHTGRNSMLGLMQDWPLLLHRIIDHAALQHGGREVVTRSIEGPMHRTTYTEIRPRALRAAKRLQKDGIKLGDRVGTLAWNTWRHLEAWYGITGIGAIYHTVNPRLFPEQIAWIVNHAADRIMMTDLTFLPILEAIAEKLPIIALYVVLTDAVHMPPTERKKEMRCEG